MLDGDDIPQNPHALNHAEFAFDERSGIAYFRVIQHGKLVPRCNKAVRIGKV